MQPFFRLSILAARLLNNPLWQLTLIKLLRPSILAQLGQIASTDNSRKAARQVSSITSILSHPSIIKHLILAKRNHWNVRNSQNTVKLRKQQVIIGKQLNNTGGNLNQPCRDLLTG